MANLDQVPEDAESVRQWLFRVARNVTIDRVRSMMARPAEVYSMTGDWTVSAENETSRVLGRQVLRDALAKLPKCIAQCSYRSLAWQRPTA